MTLRRALVFGDSQTEGLGGAVAGLLRANGHMADVVTHKGYTTERLVESAKSELTGSPTGLGAATSYDVVFIFSGGNDARKHRDFGPWVTELVRMFRPGTVWWTGPAPQTRIGAMEYARQAWNLPASAGPDYFQGQKAAEREAYNVHLRGQVEAAGATYLDLRNAGLGGADQGAGAFFPDLADGVHVTGPVAAAGAQWIYDRYARPGLLLLKKYAVVVPIVGAAALFFAWARSRR